MTHHVEARQMCGYLTRRSVICISARSLADSESLSTVQSALCAQHNHSFSLLPRLHDAAGCSTGWTTGCIVYTNIQPVVNNRFDNRLYRANGVFILIPYKNGA